MARNLYLDLLKQSLMGRLYPRPSPAPTADDLARCDKRLQEGRERFPDASGNAARILDSTPEMFFELLSEMSAQQSRHTMSAETAVDNVRMCVERVLADNVPGDLLEAGVWKGGLPLFMRGILAAYEDKARTVWVADSFQGLPEPHYATAPADAVVHFLSDGVGHLSVSQADVERTFAAYGLLDDQVRFLPGSFADTLADAPYASLAVARLDGDWYDSTREALTHAYPKLSVGGFLIIDDYGLPLGCRRAVDEFRQKHAITEPIVSVDVQTVYWRKER